MAQPTHYQTGLPLAYTNTWTGDDVSYEMLPDYALIKCQLIDDSGNKIKGDGTRGCEAVLARIGDQRIFYSDILYWVFPLGEYEGRPGTSTRASLISYPCSRQRTLTHKPSPVIPNDVYNGEVPS